MHILSPVTDLESVEGETKVDVAGPGMDPGALAHEPDVLYSVSLRD